MIVIIPQQPVNPTYQNIEWVYPNDEESQYYTYEQMLNDWIESENEEDDEDEIED